MFVYLVWEVNYNGPYLEQRLKGIFHKKKDATALKAKLGKKNDRPLESDDWGPYRGREYSVYKNKVK